jgi:hypothetical protein
MESVEAPTALRKIRMEQHAKAGKRIRDLIAGEPPQRLRGFENGVRPQPMPRRNDRPGTNSEPAAENKASNASKADCEA